jgi:glutathione S-transferase
MIACRRNPVVPEPGRVRRIGRSFAWLDHRLAREGYLERMTLADMALYVFLALAADRFGVSFYRKEVIANKLGIDWAQVEGAKARLVALGLVAFRPFSPGDVNGFYQVLPLPQGGCHDAGSVG